MWSPGAECGPVSVGVSGPRLTGSAGQAQNVDARARGFEGREGVRPTGAAALITTGFGPLSLSHPRTEGMMMRTHLDKGLWAIALLATLGFTGSAGAAVDCSAIVNFGDSQYTACFTDVRRGSDINDDNAPDLGGTGHTALNFTGGAGTAGDTWLTKFTPNGGTKICESHTQLQADVLIHTYNNAKGAGLVALLNFAPGDKGLALILYDQGNSDALQLATIDPKTGQLGKLKSVSLGAGIAENAWYRVFMNVILGGGDLVLVIGTVSRHVTPTDPNSPIVPVGQLMFEGTRSALGLEDSGEVGIAASAFSTNVNSSVTNFLISECF